MLYNNKIVVSREDAFTESILPIKNHFEKGLKVPMCTNEIMKEQCKVNCIKNKGAGQNMNQIKD